MIKILPKDLQFVALRLISLVVLSFFLTSCASKRSFSKDEQESVLSKKNGMVIFKAITLRHSKLPKYVQSVRYPNLLLDTSWKSKDSNHRFHTSDSDHWAWEDQDQLFGISTPFRIYLLPEGTYELSDMSYKEIKFSLIDSDPLIRMISGSDPTKNNEFKTHVNLPHPLFFSIKAGEILYIGDIILDVIDHNDSNKVHLVGGGDTVEDKKYDFVYIFDDFKNAQKVVYKNFEFLKEIPLSKRLISSKVAKSIDVNELKSLLSK